MNIDKYMPPKYRQALSVPLMLLAGGLIIVSTNAYVPKKYPPKATEAAETGVWIEETPEDTTEETETIPETEAEEEELVSQKPPADADYAVRLNMAYRYPAGADPSSGDQSIAGKAFRSLSERDAGWISGIYGFAGIKPADLAKQLGKDQSAVMGKYNYEDEAQSSDNPDSWVITDWSGINVSFYDGDGLPISGYSNAKEIISMASVYAYWKGIQDQETFLKYTENLWAASHRYIVSMGDVYYCEGCPEYGEEMLPVETMAEETMPAETVPTATQSNADEKEALMQQYSLEDIPPDWESLEGPGRDLWASVVEAYGEMATEIGAEEETTVPDPAEVILCPGHIDLNVSAYIDGLNQNQGLFDRDVIGSKESNLDERWNGWTRFNRLYARSLEQQDWYRAYDLTVSDSIYIRNPLSSAEIAFYMNMLPDDTSSDRKAVIRQALQSVGCIPYYWGGKPAVSGFEGNGFGSITVPDEQGRMLRGLDCSGWVNWVYWSALGSRLPYESTSGLIQCGARIEREALKPGDIIVRTGSSAHVYLFLAWTDDDHMYVIHETSGSINNVTISRYNVHWPFYRRLITD